MAPTSGTSSTSTSGTSSTPSSSAPVSGESILVGYEKWLTKPDGKGKVDLVKSTPDETKLSLDKLETFDSEIELHVVTNIADIIGGNDVKVLLNDNEIVNGHMISNTTTKMREAKLKFYKLFFKNNLKNNENNVLKIIIEDKTKKEHSENVNFYVNITKPEVTNIDGKFNNLSWGHELDKDELSTEGFVEVKTTNANNGKITMEIFKLNCDSAGVGVPVIDKKDIDITQDEFKIPVRQDELNRLEDNTFYKIKITITKDGNTTTIDDFATFFTDKKNAVPKLFDDFRKNVIDKTGDLNNQTGSIVADKYNEIQQFIYKNLHALVEKECSGGTLKPVSNKTITSAVRVSNFNKFRYDFHIARKLMTGYTPTETLVDDFVRLLGDPFQDFNWPSKEDNPTDGPATLFAKQKDKINQYRKKGSWTGIKQKGDKEVATKATGLWNDENAKLKTIKNTYGDLIKEQYNEV